MNGGLFGRHLVVAEEGWTIFSRSAPGAVHVYATREAEEIIWRCLAFATFLSVHSLCRVFFGWWRGHRARQNSLKVMWTAIFPQPNPRKVQPSRLSS